MKMDLGSVGAKVKSGAAAKPIKAIQTRVGKPKKVETKSFMLHMDAGIYKKLRADAYKREVPMKVVLEEILVSHYGA